MTYRIKGLQRGQFDRYFSMGEAELARHHAELVTADSDRGYPCRVSLDDAREGDRLLLVHHVHHAVDTPFRSAFAIYVREAAREAADFADRCPPLIERRTVSLRGFSAEGHLQGGTIAAPGEADKAIRGFLSDRAIAYIDLHNAALGCFLARAERSEA